MTIYDLPVVNATLNGLSGVLLVTARNRIKHGKRKQHRALMIAAYCTSILFLISYLTYHFGAHVLLHFGGTGWIRPAYFTLLTSHTILAVAVPVLATITLMRGLKNRFSAHRKIAKWTYPIWLYVSVTGVVIYILLYQIYPPVS
jgi:protein SCO1/2/putative membrane protein